MKAEMIRNSNNYFPNFSLKESKLLNLMILPVNFKTKTMIDDDQIDLISVEETTKRKPWIKKFRNFKNWKYASSILKLLKWFQCEFENETKHWSRVRSIMGKKLRILFSHFPSIFPQTFEPQWSEDLKSDKAQLAKMWISHFEKVRE
jgi:hypothetical protein